MGVIDTGETGEIVGVEEVSLESRICRRVRNDGKGRQGAGAGWSADDRLNTMHSEIGRITTYDSPDYKLPIPSTTDYPSKIVVSHISLLTSLRGSGPTQ